MATIDKPKGIHVRAKDIGAIEEIDFYLPGGGITMLKGRSGTGKSTLINAMQYAGTGTGEKPEPRDGCDKGEIEFSGLLVRFGRVARKSGELDVELLVGDSIADLIEPPNKDRAVCDIKAIRILSRLTGAADESLFYDLVGGKEEFERLCPSDVAGDLDVVTIADRVKRALQKQARSEEDLAKAADSKADALGASARDVDCDFEHDSNKLTGTLEKAISANAALGQKALDAETKTKAAANARENLKAAEDELAGVSVDKAQGKVTGAQQILAEAITLLNRRKTEFEEARRLFNEQAVIVTQMESAVDLAESQLKSAQDNERLLTRFRETIKAGDNIELVTDEELSATAKAVHDAKQGVELGAIIRKAIADRETATDWRVKAKDHRKKAESYRNSADGCDDVLSGLVSKLGSDLFVEHGTRLMIKSDRAEVGGKESYWDLSGGERSKVAVTVVANGLRKMGKPTVIPLPQPYWEGMEYEARMELKAMLEEAGVDAVVAEVNRTATEPPELRAEVYTG